jgi:hypothetical protein
MRTASHAPLNNALCLNYCWDGEVRHDEEFVGRALVEYFGGPSRASVREGEDPPDLYLAVEGSRVGVEVTQLSQFTFGRDGSFGNRNTQDSFGVRIIEDLNTKLGAVLPADVGLLIGLWVPVPHAQRFRKRLTEWITSIAEAPEKGFKEEREIEGSKVCVSVISERSLGKKITGFVVNNNASADIGLNARLVLQDRVRSKDYICARLPKPIWLAVLNDYWLADPETYTVAARQLRMEHCFGRIFLVSDNGAVNELTFNA